MQLKYASRIAAILFLTLLSACKKDTKATPQDEYVVTILAGSGDGFADGTGTAARFSGRMGIATDAQGNVFVADVGNDRVRKITPAGVVTTLAGSSSTVLYTSQGWLTADAQGNVYAAEGPRIRKFTPAGEVSTIAGSTPGFADGPVSTAKFANIGGITVDAQGTIYVSDIGNNRIRKITPGGVVSTLAEYISSFGNLFPLASDLHGNVYVADYAGRRISKITTAGVVSTFASIGQSPGSGPSGVATDAAGNVYVTESGFFGVHHHIDKIDAAGVVTVIAGGNRGYTDGNGSTAQFDTPVGVATDAQGTIYVTDYGNNRIRKISKK
ncbi:MAG: hypothetical protein ICV65_11680 [Flavisolibacter sp.]|nr:hypothetical protein [Flavisolibacter sp.]